MTSMSMQALTEAGAYVPESFDTLGLVIWSAFNKFDKAETHTHTHTHACTHTDLITLLLVHAFHDPSQ